MSSHSYSWCCHNKRSRNKAFLQDSWCFRLNRTIRHFFLFFFGPRSSMILFHEWRTDLFFFLSPVQPRRSFFWIVHARVQYFTTSLIHLYLLPRVSPDVPCLVAHTFFSGLFLFFFHTVFTTFLPVIRAYN